jgi:hypothetical protein
MKRTLWLGLALGTTLALARDPLLGQGGTDCCQVLQIPAAAFAPRSSTVQFEHLSPGYLYLTSTGSLPTNQLWAPVNLPTGARIQSIGFVYYDADGTNDITARLRAFNHGTPATGGSPGFFDIISTASAGCCGTGYSSAATDHTVLNDAANDPDASQYTVVIDYPVASADLAFKSVQIAWQRQVSPAPATPTFGDVPPSDGAFAFIEALAASGITAGCGAGNFCPDAALTRRQMAVFLSKALGLHWPS